MQNPIKPFRVGSLLTEGNVFLAPMAGYTDIPMRELAIRHGADLTWTEMISAEGLYRDSRKTIDMMKPGPHEKNYVIQLFMGSATPVAKAVAYAESFHPAMIDVNAGCPVPKVTKTGSGSALMKDPPAMEAIVREMTKHTAIPVSVKFRLGWDGASVNFLDFADACVQGGASVLTLHTRTRSQGYAPFAHPEKLGELCAWRDRHCPEVKIIASGDIFSARDAVKTLRDWPVDGVMAARGAIGNPFLFEDAKALAAGREPEPLTLPRRIQALMEHLDAQIALYGERSGCHQMRKSASFYLHGLRGTAEARQAFNTAEKRSDYVEILSRLTAKIGDGTLKR